jgi:hypothetical protein
VLLTYAAVSVSGETSQTTPQKQNGTAPRQNRGAVATGSIWAVTQAWFLLRPCALTSVIRALP